MKYLRQEPGFYRVFFSRLIPLAAQNLIVQSMTLVDTFMVGALGEKELASVTAANSLFFIIMLVCFGLQSGACVLASQYHGRGNISVLSRILGVGVYFSAGLCILVSSLSFAFSTHIMRVLTDNAELIDPGGEYMRIAGFSFIFSSISAMYFALLRSAGHPKPGAVIMSCSGLSNIFLNWVLIFGSLGAPALGIKGAALATLISRAAELAVVLWYMRVSSLLRIDIRHVLMPGIVILKDFLRYALPVGANELLWSASMSFFAIIMGHMPGSTQILAAYTIAGNIERVIAVVVLSCGATSAITIGNEIGLGRSGTIYSKAVALNILGFFVGCISCALLLLFRVFAARQFVFPLMGFGQIAQDIALFMITVTALLQPLRAMNMVNILGVLRGGGDVGYALIADVAPMYLFCLPLAAVFGLSLGYGITAVYLCILGDDIAKFIICSHRLRSKKWINDLTRDNI